MQHCRVVLLQTHYPGNLGATARAMRNFGLCDLVLVSPIADRTDRRALEMSTHGEAILNNARIVDTLEEAVADCVLLVGTSAKHGGLFRRQSVGEPDAIMPLVVDVLLQQRPVALLFGPEPSGLSNEIVTRCHHLIHIPVDEEYSSLNLAQAVAISLHELRKAWLRATAAPATEPNRELAPLDAQERLFHHLQVALEEIEFLFGERGAPLMHAIRHLLGKARLSNMEVQLLHGLARQLRWVVANSSKKTEERPGNS